MIPPGALGRWEPLTVDQLAAKFRSAPFPWWIVGGWAIDLFIGRETRSHEDIEIAVLRRDQMDLQHWLRGWELWYGPTPGAGLARWPEGAQLGAQVHEVWCREEPKGPWRLEVLLEEADAGRWRYRRDPRVTASLESIAVEVRGLPVIRPEVALLYKSKGSRERDEADFRTVLPHLDDSARRWLLEALQNAGTGSAWIEALRS